MVVGLDVHVDVDGADRVEIDARDVAAHGETSRRRDFSSLPEALWGSSGTNTTDFGSL